MREWFNNRSRATTAGTGRRSGLDLIKQSKTRLLSIYHAYSAMFKLRLGPIIDKEWADAVMSQRLAEEDKLKSIPAVPINFRNAALKRMLADESTEVKAQVEAWRQAQRTLEIKDEGDDDEVTRRLAVANRYHK